MRLRTTVPAITAAALLAAILALPGQALADSTPAPTGTPVAGASASPSDSGTPTASPSDSNAPTASPSDSGTPTDSASPTAGPTADPSTSPTAGTTPADAPTISAVTPVDTAQGRVLQVRASSSIGVGSVSATLSSGGVDTTVNTFVQQGDGVWQSGVVVLPDYASYTESVTAVDTAGTSSAAFTGSMDYYKRPAFDSSTTITPSTLSYGHSTVTATGKLDTWDPATGLHTDEPYLGDDETLTLNNGAGTAVAWGYLWSYQNNANFSLTYSPNYSGFKTDVLTLNTTYAHGTVTGPAAAVAKASLTATRVRLDRSTATALANTTVSVTGTVEYLDSVTNTWKPLANQAFKYLDQYGWYVGYYTDANGRFSIGVSTTTPRTWTFATDSSDYRWDSWLADSTANFSVTSVTQTVSLSLSSPQIDEYSDLTFYQSVYTSNGKIPNNRVYLLQSANGKTWTNLGYIPTTGSQSQQFQAWVSNPHAYWRLYSPAGGGYQAAFSNVIHTFRYGTLLTGGKPNHTTVKKNGWVTFRGGLYDQGYGAWAPMKNTRVYLAFRPYGSKNWSLATSAKTNSKGAYSLSAKASRGGTWEVVWFTSNTWFVDAFGPSTYVHVK
ncbi:hypothetical protein ACEZCY_15975 [Streptacidiphilus sp. N1-12]|uniref:Uncharacterized protein n=2 Tax=Streptacidiphilus alkalitolerans TaxID=3342712 RepID=A0ABV6WFE8_9ACTN